MISLLSFDFVGNSDISFDFIVKLKRPCGVKAANLLPLFGAALDAKFWGVLMLKVGPTIDLHGREKRLCVFIPK